MAKPGEHVCKECGAVHRIGCLATGSQSCEAEKYLCDCGVKMRTEVKK